MSATQPIKNKEKLEMFRNYYKKIEYRPRNYALIVLGLNSALRISDILELRWKDVYTDNTYRKHIYVIEKKTKKENILAMNPSSLEALEMYRGTLTGFHESDYIFCKRTNPGSPLSRSQAFRIIKKAVAYCGLEDYHISCHSLRKTFGYYAWQGGTPPALLMSIYNHSSYEITKRYLGIDQTEKDEVYLKNIL